MEVIELSSYTDEEKLQIAKQHLLPKQLKRHGLKKSQVKLTDDAIRELIVSYTRESGVRVLERELGALCRKVAMGIVSEEYKQAHVTGDNLEQFLGPRKFHPEKNGLENQVGLVNGLAWTAVGGTLLEAEANVIPGSGKVELTGNLGNVMKSRPGRPSPISAAGQCSWALRPTSTRRRTSTSTSQRGPCPRTAPPPG